LSTALPEVVIDVLKHATCMKIEKEDAQQVAREQARKAE
jgi:hypothetical protein